MYGQDNLMSIEKDDVNALIFYLGMCIHTLTRTHVTYVLMPAQNICMCIDNI